MRLTELLDGYDIEVTRKAEIAETDIKGLASDSRRVMPGFLFAALPGSQHDGRLFIPDAIKRGASAVLSLPILSDPESAENGFPPNVVRISDHNPRRRLALMAARFHGRQPATVAAVTGTNGKTSVVSFLSQIWSRLGHSAASLGTLGVQAPDGDRGGNLTTPDPIELHAALAGLAADGVDHLAMEASSHGLSQYRLDGVRIAAAAFTNLTRDHLDYHGTMAHYLEAKQRLFTDLLSDDGTAVINADDEAGREVHEVARKRGLRVLTFGRKGDDVRLIDSYPKTDGQRLAIDVAGEVYDVALPIVGEFQASNVLCALALAVATGAPTARVMETLSTLKGVRGRLERVARLRNGAVVYVDYAHTPDALSAALGAIRPHTNRRLSVVFGCGGDRDPGKRPEMGRIAQDLADRVFVTDDNPRGEDPAAIRGEILAACPQALEIDGRGKAIASAIADLRAGDVLVVAGKGHETGQIIGARTTPFDDAVEVHRAIAGIEK